MVVSVVVMACQFIPISHMVILMVMVMVMMPLIMMVRSTWTDAMSAAVLSTNRFLTTAFFNLSDCFFSILFECFFISCILEAK